MDSKNSPVWFVTGCSTGFGRALSQLLVAQGFRVVVTARDVTSIDDIVSGNTENALAVSLDVTDASAIAAAVAQATARFGAIDVLVNNAGYGYFAAVEEGEDAVVRQMFETNFFGLVAMTKAVLPGMRERRSGHIVNLSSIAGLLSFPGAGYYSAAKFAVEGLSGSLALELAPLGIKVILVEPGPFRTDFAGRSFRQTSLEISDYTATAGEHRRRTQARSGNQKGDPVRAAQAIINAVAEPNPPLHLLLGAAAFELVQSELSARSSEFLAWKAVSLATDYPDA